jgi:hypothetical protein
MGEVRHVAFGTGAERQAHADQENKPGRGGQPRICSHNTRHFSSHHPPNYSPDGVGAGYPVCRSRATNVISAGYRNMISFILPAM